MNTNFWKKKITNRNVFIWILILLLKWKNAFGGCSTANSLIKICAFSKCGKSYNNSVYLRPYNSFRRPINLSLLEKRTMLFVFEASYQWVIDSNYLSIWLEFASDNPCKWKYLSDLAFSMRHFSRSTNIKSPCQIGKENFVVLLDLKIV